MTQDFCFSLLHATTIQILKAAGFSAGHVQATRVLTDVFLKYIELLSCTASANSRLLNRTTGNIYDLLSAFEELSIDTNELKEWLKDEAGALSPSWTEQGDPSRALKGTVSGELNRQSEGDLYEYGSPPELILEEREEEDEEEARQEQDTATAAATDEQETNLPSYVPPYFPAFPSTTLTEEQEQQAVSVDSKQAPVVSKDTLPLPNIVKKRLKPIDNPFAHLKPLEDSILASTDNDQPEALSLSLLKQTSATANAIDTSRKSIKRKLPNSDLEDIAQKIHSHTDSAYKHLLTKDAALLNDATQQQAAPGNTIFGRELGMLEKLVADITLPIAIPKLTTPNLMIDTAVPQSASEPLTPHTKPQKQTRKQSLGGITIEETSARKKAPVNLGISTAEVSQNDDIWQIDSCLSSAKSTTPMSLASLSGSNNEESAKSAVKERKRSASKPKKKLTISLPNPNSQPNSALSSADTETPKIRFKIKLPQPPVPPVATDTPPSSAPSSPKDVIQCICDNPTVDYGTFMIACDGCGVWYHGSCVGIAESDQVKEWYCKRCAAK